MDQPTKISLQKTYQELYNHSLAILLNNLTRLRTLPDLPADDKFKILRHAEESLSTIKRAVIFFRNTEPKNYVMPELPLPKKDK